MFAKKMRLSFLKITIYSTVGLSLGYLNGCQYLPKSFNKIEPEKFSSIPALIPVRNVGNWMLDDYVQTQQLSSDSINPKVPSIVATTPIPNRLQMLDILTTYYQALLQIIAQNPLGVQQETETLLQQLTQLSTETADKPPLDFAPLIIDFSQLLTQMRQQYQTPMVASVFKQHFPALAKPLLLTLRQDCTVFYQAHYQLYQQQQQQYLQQLNEARQQFYRQTILLSTTKQKQLVLPMIETINRRLTVSEFQNLPALKLPTQSGQSNDTLIMARLGVEKEKILTILDQREQQTIQLKNYKKMLLRYRKMLNRLDAHLKHTVLALQQQPPLDITASAQAFDQALTQVQQAYANYQHNL